jgi:outer membrane immunogenic protein
VRIAYWRFITRGRGVRKYVLGTAALIALARPAIAADFADPVYGAPPVWHWTGCYAGGHAGGLGGSSEKWIVRTPGGDFQGQSLGGHDVDSFIGGVQAGCDYQFAGGIVIGIQGDHGWTNAGGSHPSTREFGVSYHSKVESLTSVTGRIGYAWDRYLGYFKGGGAWEEVDYSASTIITGTAYRASDTRSGWTIGAGGEYAFSKHLSVFVEYTYYDFGTEDFRLTPQLVGLRPGFVDIEETANVVRAGVNLRFGG